MKNNIYIIGAGAIGKALAVSLKHAGKDVVLLRGRVDDKSNSRRKIQVVLNDGTELESEIAVSTINYFSELEGIIVLTNKSYANEDLSRRLKNRIKNSPVVVLQNGLGVEKVFVDHDFPEIYRCVLFVTSQNISQNKVRFKPVSVCPIGIIKGNQANLATIVTKLNSPHFRFRAEPEIQTLIWKKAIINCVFNSICPLLEIDNGVFHREESVLEIAKRLIKECVEISKVKGIALETDEIIESLLLISRSSDGQLISTLQDIKNKRQTEIETLNFEIVRMAKTLKMEEMVRETKLLGEMTKLKSELSK